MGLVNRLTEPGKALDVAVALAEELGGLPQGCLRGDRLSAYEQWELPGGEAMRNETRRGLEVIRSGETVAGAARFAAGAGRHGTPDAGGTRPAPTAGGSSSEAEEHP